jgi:hypothetical protein
VYSVEIIDELAQRAIQRQGLITLLQRGPTRRRRSIPIAAIGFSDFSTGDVKKPDLLCM